MGLCNALLLILVMQTDILESSGAFALLVFAFISVASTFIVLTLGPPPRTRERYIQLQIIAVLTLLIPLFGASFGLPNQELGTLLQLVGVGILGGAAWALPFAIWRNFRGAEN